MNYSASENSSGTASDGEAGDGFGYDVAISGDYVAVGAPGKNISQGQGYVFVRSGTTWIQQAMLTALNGDRFGSRIAIFGDYIVVGSPDSDDQGWAKVYGRSGAIWPELATLRASDSYSGDSFDYSVAISGDHILVGALLHRNVNLDSHGRIYVFSRHGPNWIEQAILTASEAAGNDGFGVGVAISGNNIIDGAPGKDIGGNSNQGKVYFFSN